MRRVLFILCAASALSGIALAALPEGDKAMDRLSAVLGDLRDLSCDIEVHTPGKQASGSLVLQYARSKEDGKEKVARKYILITRTSTPDGAVVVKQVNDGTQLWVEQKNAETGAVKVTRRRVEPEGPVPGGFGMEWRRQMETWRKNYDFRTLREDTFDGEKVIVVEGTRKPGVEAPAKPDLTSPERLVLSISARDDFARKVDFYVKVAAKQPDGTTAEREVLLVSVRFLHVKLNAGLKPDAFDYVIPDGAEFADVK